MKPVYQLTPISDHAKELLSKIDTIKEITKKCDIYASDLNTFGAYAEREAPNQTNQKESFPRLYGEKYKNEPAYTEEQVKGLESMYGHNRAKLVDVDIKREKVVNYYKRVSLIIPNEKLESFKGVFFDKCIIEFSNQDFAGQLYNQGCRFDDCRIIYHLHATQMNYSLTRK